MDVSHDGDGLRGEKGTLLSPIASVPNPLRGKRHVFPPPPVLTDPPASGGEELSIQSVDWICPALFS
ncbi:hypothetical protein EYF80_032512 [Liparis tanakae]|uniref:Uncharacterized protein n=1 Tax=Liparis tanakae TaxID=230148 RepID=A0A4Z2GWV6_9TELE|nr:hypothetical protein EYF80_032512 [Liparis tanakae]